MSYQVFYISKMHYSPIFILLALLPIAWPNGIPFDATNTNSNEDEILTRDAASCTAWYLTQPSPKELLARTIKPPCSILSTFPPTLPGGWSVDPGCDASKQPNTCDFHIGAHGCYRNTIASTGPGAQACYDAKGQWISDPWKGAGTLDVETPLGDLVQQGKHLIVDVVPYYSCCKTSLFFQKTVCNLYYEKRPPGQCQN